MIADDDPGIVDAVKMMLEFEVYEVSSTLDGSTLLELQGDFPDLFLLDIWMSGVDGRDICSELKKRGRTRDIPVIMISASTNLARSAREAGADDFLEKPFNMNELINKITQHLRI